MRVLTPLTVPTIELEGRALTPRERASLATVVVLQALSRPAACEIVLRGLDLGGAAAELEVGQAVAVRPGDDLAAVFEGEVTAVDRRFGPTGLVELRVRAYDRLHRLRARQPVRAHEGGTCAALAEQLLADDGVEVEATGAGVAWHRRVQFRQTDFDVLADACRDAGLGFFLRGSVLRLHPLSGNGTALPVQLGDELLQARLQHNENAATASVRALGWDPARVEAVAGSADQPLATAGDPDAGGASGTWSLLGEVAADDAQAASLAQGELDRRASTQVVFWGELEGDSALFPGVELEVGGLSADVAQRFTACQVLHRFDAERGYTCEVDSRPPRAARRPWGTLVGHGVVLDIDDPDRRGRVRARLPAYGDLETEWLQVAVPAAGPGKGLLVLPDVGDRVLVLFPREDLAHGVVLGGLFGGEELPEPGGAHQHETRSYTLRTAGRQFVHLDDRDRLLRVGIAGGSYVELAPDGMRLHAQSDLQIEAPGHRITIAAAKVDFQQSQ